MVERRTMELGNQLLEWYYQNKRDLPWRNTKDPYKIWFSEIILQQTRVAQGLPYYLKFVQQFPDILSLANADEQQVMKLWQGLGYYSRALNFHAAAKQIVNTYHGIFPSVYEEILQLRGIGDYTASAIASLAFDLPYTVVDGNVKRFISRLYGIRDNAGKQSTVNLIKEKASRLRSGNPSGDFNQAMMEFGAIVCKPAQPLCSDCFFNSECSALKMNLVDEIPFKIRKTELRERYLHYFLFTYSVRNTNFIYIRKRGYNDIWKGLYDFPLVENQAFGEKPDLNILFNFSQDNSTQYTVSSVEGPVTHLLTHQRLLIWFHHIKTGQALKLPFISVNVDQLVLYPFPKVIDRFLSGKKYL